MEDYTMIKSDYLERELNERGISIQVEKTAAGNNIRFFVYKKQKIYFDTETVWGGTKFSWPEYQAKNLFLILDNVKEEDQQIYYAMEEETQVFFTWGWKEYLLPVEFSGYWEIRNGKVCREIGL